MHASRRYWLKQLLKQRLSGQHTFQQARMAFEPEVQLALDSLDAQHAPRCTALARTLQMPPPGRLDERAAASRVLWFTTLVPFLNQSLASWRMQVQMAKTTIESARLFAPSLEPHIMYVGPPDGLTRWMERRGVHVHHWQLSFSKGELDHKAACSCPTGTRFTAACTRRAGCGTDDPNQHYYQEFVLGAWAKLDVPFLVRNLSASGALWDHALGRRYSASRLPDLVLVTDLDLVFVKDIKAVDLRGPFPLASGSGSDGGSKLTPVAFMAAASDQGGDGVNTGVWVQNVSGMLRERAALLRDARSRHFGHGQHEQTLVNKHFSHGGARRGTAIPRLPATWNSRASLRCRVSEDEAPKEALPSPHAFCAAADLGHVPGIVHGGRFLERRLPVCSAVRVWHFHGIKTHQIRCSLDVLQDFAHEHSGEQSGDALRLHRGLRGAGANRGSEAHSFGLSNVTHAREAMRRCLSGVDLYTGCDECAIVKYAWLHSLGRRIHDQHNFSATSYW